MSRSDKIRAERNEYYLLRDNIKLACDKLLIGTNNLRDVSQEVVNAYSIDGVSADAGELIKQHKDLEGIYNSLKWTVLPEINRNIDRLSSLLEDAIIAETLEISSVATVSAAPKLAAKISPKAVVRPAAKPVARPAVNKGGPRNVLY